MSGIAPKEKYRRLTLVKDSMTGVSYHLPNPEVLLFPFLDNLLLLHQAPLVFAFWDGERRVYDTLKDPDFLRRHEVTWNCAPHERLAIPGTPYSLSLHDFRRPNPLNGKVRLDVDAEATALTAPLLDATKKRFFLPKELLEGLGQAIALRARREAASSEHEAAGKDITPLDLDYGKVRGLLAPIRAVLGSVFEDSSSGGVLKIEIDGFSYPNIFSVVRTVPRPGVRYGSFPYTAGLLLLPQMEESLNEWCVRECLRSSHCPHAVCPLEHTDPASCMAALEHPLGPDSRSVSDLVFSSGIVDFGRRAQEEGWDVSVVGNDDDRNRRTVEGCIYPRNRDLFYIPLHVGGTPWVAIFTFSPKDRQEAWDHNYSFYRDLIQKAAELVRLKAQDVYSDLVAKTVVANMKSWIASRSDLVAAVNNSLQTLAQVYPFPQLTLRDAEGTGEFDLHVPGRGTFGVDFIQNPFFARHVSWRLGDEKQIRETCTQALADFTSRESMIEINAVAQSSHLVKSPLRVLASILASDSSRRDDHLKRQVEKLLSLHDAVSGLANHTKRTQMLSRWRTEDSAATLRQIIETEHQTALAFLSEPSVSGNRADRVREMRSGKQISFDDSALSDLQEERVAFYRPQLAAVFDGLILNAVDNVDDENPKVDVILRVRTVKHGGSRVVVEFRNTTDIPPSGLDTLCRQLNSPRPDMVGVTELHWIADTFWPALTERERLLWRWEVCGDQHWVSAEAVIAEVVR